MSFSATTTDRREGLPRGDDKVRAVRHMFDAIAGRYELVNSIVSFGLDRGWRHRCIEALGLPSGSVVLDVACGTGDLCRQLATRGYTPVGVDLSPGMLSHARTTAPLVLADALAGPFRSAVFDGAVSGFALRNVVDLGALFSELARAIRPGGRVSLLDLSEPEAGWLRLGHHYWSSYGVPLVGSLLSDANAYRYLPRSYAYLPPAPEVVGLLERAGFGGVEHELLSGGISQLYVGTRQLAVGT
jgi:demethylmenaquinone methyltransferase / 2-methoxy-6-polyprenyl-1,4-benzoquinol methylase